jgi:hypothetical protein
MGKKGKGGGGKAAHKTAPAPEQKSLVGGGAAASSLPEFWQCLDDKAKRSVLQVSGVRRPWAAAPGEEP